MLRNRACFLQFGSYLWTRRSDLHKFFYHRCSFGQGSPIEVWKSSGSEVWIRSGVRIHIQIPDPDQILLGGGIRSLTALVWDVVLNRMDWGERRQCFLADTVTCRSSVTWRESTPDSAAACVVSKSTANSSTWEKRDTSAMHSTASTSVRRSAVGVCGIQGGTMTGFTLKHLNGNFYFLHHLQLTE